MTLARGLLAAATVSGAGAALALLLSDAFARERLAHGRLRVAAEYLAILCLGLAFSGTVAALENGL